jgi:putative transcriptional regulator
MAITMITRIKELRAKHNLTQGELAQIAGVRRETIVFLEKGRYNPSLKLAHDIAKFFNLPVEEIFIFEDKKGKEEEKEEKKHEKDEHEFRTHHRSYIP